MREVTYYLYESKNGTFEIRTSLPKQYKRYICEGSWKKCYHEKLYLLKKDPPETL